MLPLVAEEDLAKLVVEVKTLAGKPIDRASVIVKFVEGRSIAKFGKKIKTNWELRTNQQGMVKIPPVPQGKILVQVIAKGYQTFGQTFEILEEDKTIGSGSAAAAAVFGARMTTGEFRWPLRIQFVDTDASGRIHYTATLRHFETAEAEFMPHRLPLRPHRGSRHGLSARVHRV